MTSLLVLLCCVILGDLSGADPVADQIVVPEAVMEVVAQDPSSLTEEALKFVKVNLLTTSYGHTMVADPEDVADGPLEMATCPAQLFSIYNMTCHVSNDSGNLCPNSHFCFGSAGNQSSIGECCPNTNLTTVCPDRSPPMKNNKDCFTDEDCGEGSSMMCVGGQAATNTYGLCCGNDVVRQFPQSPRFIPNQPRCPNGRRHAGFCGFFGNDGLCPRGLDCIRRFGFDRQFGICCRTTRPLCPRGFIETRQICNFNRDCNNRRNGPHICRRRFNMRHGHCCRRTFFPPRSGKKDVE